MASGIPVPWPWRIANAEARARQHAASVIGEDRALGADLRCVNRDGALSFALVGESAGLSEQQIEKLNASLSMLTPAGAA
ncbi:hypothetical protein HL653_02635 [Sphingomonas sp. AP4-R1]|uniref:hypothetical protein n=1 Tax=Sphingomonas sp. AP4-R1 TaxID=2735134 RepID=UPI0014936570|nr:hypothetical protein [Sphingomonas sp. AP4-R1]QJU56831.1 hypothetical protein HL653_02635 [Sphingomonas sp. AP4-R1]